MAGAFLRALARETLDAASTATKANVVHPLAYQVMKEAGVDLSRQFTESIADTFKEHFTTVITISDAARERHPIYPFTLRLVHWSIADPAPVEVPPLQSLELLRRVRDEIREQVGQFLADIGDAQAEEHAVVPSRQIARAAS
jgi:arsenate reductase (thioredoxin)